MGANILKGVHPKRAYSGRGKGAKEAAGDGDGDGDIMPPPYYRDNPLV